MKIVFVYAKEIKYIDFYYTPLNNYNGTPKGRLNRDLRATLPINKLKGKPQVAVCPILYQRRFETAPLRGAIVQTVTGNLVEVLSAERIEIFNGVNVHRCKNIELINIFILW